MTISIPETPGPVWVTPELAGLWLTRNEKNRSIRHRLVNTLARDMATEHWVLTGEAIKFDKDGRLMDGQHRLLAVLKSGATVQMFVIPNLPNDAQAFMDAGARRSAGDALQFREEVNASTLASTVRLAITSAGRQKDAISNAEIIEWLEHNPDIRRYVTLCMRWRTRLDMKPSVFAFAMWRLHQIDERDAAHYMDDIVEMRTGGSGDPVYALIQRFRTARKNRETTNAATELNWIYRCWNAYRVGGQVKILKVPISDQDVVIPR